MNPVQIRQIYNAARQETLKSWELEQQEIRFNLVRLQNELHFATEQCPNRCLCIRLQMDEYEASLRTNKVEVFDAKCQSFVDRVDQLNPDEVEELFRRMGVVYRPSSIQVSSSSYNNASSTSNESSSDLYICSKCDEVRVCDEFEAFSVCMKCGHALPFHKETGEAAETLQYTMQFEYDRVNHFRECLNQIIKAVENIPSIDRKVFRYIKRQIIKERITNRAMITRKRIKDWLKRDKNMNKYSERVFSILYAVCKIRPPKISKALEQKFYEMFHDIQKPFSKHVPPGRTHFFNYSFILRKFCELLGQDQLVPVFDILKGVDRVHFQDEIWKRCCAEKGYKFIPSI
jgi:hypothetical protein